MLGTATAAMLFSVCSKSSDLASAAAICERKRAPRCSRAADAAGAAPHGWRGRGTQRVCRRTRRSRGRAGAPTARRAQGPPLLLLGGGRFFLRRARAAEHVADGVVAFVARVLVHLLVGRRP